MNSRIYRFCNVIYLIVILCFTTSFTYASATNGTETHVSGKKEFNPSDMILEHVLDAHEWHIFTFRNLHVSIPLPIILIDNGKLTVFSSGKFYHGSQSYKGYKLMTEGKEKGKILKVDEQDNPLVGVRPPFDISITKNVASMFLGSILLSLIFISIARRYKKAPNTVPKGLQSLLEPLILFIRDDVAIPSIGKKKYHKYLPYLLTIFFFIFFNNLLGIIPIFPGGANLSGNITLTVTLALFTFAITLFSGNKHYWKDIVNTEGVPWWLKVPIPLMPVVELMGVFTKPFVLAIRLFANITGGHIIILTFISLIFIFGNINPVAGYASSVVSILFAVFMSFLELLVAFIQAYVFTLLSAIYFGMATEEHHHSKETTQHPTKNI